MIAEGMAALSAIKQSIDITRTVIDAKTEIERVGAVADLQRALLDIQGKALDLQMRCASLQEENLDLRRRLSVAMSKDAGLNRYEMFSFTDTGAIAYRLKKEEREEGELEHFICSGCFDKGERAVLQQNGRFLKCGSCGLSISTKKAQPLSQSRKGNWLIV